MRDSQNGVFRHDENIAYAKTKAQISFAVTAKLISAYLFATWIAQFLYFLNPKFPTSCHLQCLYSSVCVGPVENHIIGFVMMRRIYCKVIIMVRHETLIMVGYETVPWIENNETFLLKTFSG